MAASTARQVIMQRLRDAEDEQKYGHFAGVEGDIVSGVVQQGSDTRTVLVDLGKIEAIMPLSRAGARRALRARHPDPGLRGLGSQGTPGAAGRGFAHPSGTGGEAVQARGARDRRRDRRDQGRRSRGRAPQQDRGVSHNSDVSAKGACIGPMGQRVRAVMHELNEEKIDIIDYSPDPATFVGKALSPAKVTSVTVVDENLRAARVVVPDYQLSLAIGREGQNARLAARLTGWRIDIRSDTAPRDLESSPRFFRRADSATRVTLASADGTRNTPNAGER